MPSYSKYNTPAPENPKPIGCMKSQPAQDSRNQASGVRSQDEACKSHSDTRGLAPGPVAYPTRAGKLEPQTSSLAATPGFCYSNPLC